MADSHGFFCETPTTKICASGMRTKVDELLKACRVLSGAFDQAFTAYGRSKDIRKLMPVFEDYQELIADKITVVINSEGIENQTPEQQEQFMKHIWKLRDSFDQLEDVRERLSNVDPRVAEPLTEALDTFESTLQSFIKLSERSAQSRMDEQPIGGVWF